jgi:hypothetical protein
MSTPTSAQSEQWPGWHRVLFRFFFIYFLLFIDPVLMTPSLPVWKYIQLDYAVALKWVVNLADRLLFHIQPVGVVQPANDGSGDTSYFWAQLWTYVLLAAIGCLVWSLLDRRRPGYKELGYWLRTAIRYYIALECFLYGILKVFCLQMPAPSLSQLATPLGDLGAMRLSWIYMGYSHPYEIFSGMAEVITGLLLLHRRTVTLGLMTGLAVFINVMMMNLSYDIPVKGYSMQLAFACLFLLVWDHRRLSSFLVLNKAVGPSRLYEPVDSGRVMRIARIVLKLGFIFVAICEPVDSDIRGYNRVHQVAAMPINRGVYAVRTFVVNGDTIAPSYLDGSRWKDVIFDTRGRGSVGSPDTTFTRKFGYGRGLFHYETDTVARILTMTRSATDHSLIMQCRYDEPDSNVVVLRGRLGRDSLDVVLQRLNKEFQLEKWQFHWVSESNR